MNVLLWVLQIGLALLYLAGGSYKVFKFDALATYMRAVFAQTRRYQPDGLGGRDGAAVGLRGLRPVRVGGRDDPVTLSTTGTAAQRRWARR